MAADSAASKRVCGRTRRTAKCAGARKRGLAPSTIDVAVGIRSADGACPLSSGGDIGAPWKRGTGTEPGTSSAGSVLILAQSQSPFSTPANRLCSSPGGRTEGQEAISAKPQYAGSAVVRSTGNRCALPRPPDHSCGDFFANSASMTFTNAGSSGRVRGENRATTRPLRPMTNFSKFQSILPGPLGLVSSEVRCL